MDGVALDLQISMGHALSARVVDALEELDVFADVVEEGQAEDFRFGGVEVFEAILHESIEVESQFKPVA